MDLVDIRPFAVGGRRVVEPETNEETRPRLPLLMLGPKGFALFRLLWLAMLALAVVSPIAGLWYYSLEIESQQRPFGRSGLTFDVTDGIIRISQPRNEAGRADRGGGRLIGNYDQRIAEDLTPIPHGDRSPAGASTPATRSAQDVGPNASPTARVAPSPEQHYRGSGIDVATDRAIERAFGLVPPLLLVGLAIVLFRRRSRDPAAALLSLSFLMLAATVVHASHFYIGIGLPGLGDLILMLGWLGLMLVLLSFPSGHFPSRWARGVALALPPFGIIVFLGLLPREIETLLWIGFFGLSVCVLAGHHRKLPQGVEKRQARWVLFGFAVGILLITMAALCFILLHLGMSPPAQIWLRIAGLALAVLSFASIAVGLLVALLKFGLYDAEAVISRSALYGMVIAVLGGVFAVAVKGLEFGVETIVGQEAGDWPAFVAAGLSALLVVPVRGRAQRWAEKQFQRDLISLRRDLPQFLRDLREVATMDQLLRHILHRARAAVPSVHSALLLADNSLVAEDVAPEQIADWRQRTLLPAEMQREPGDPLFPLRIPLKVDGGPVGETIGWILLGARPDGSFHGRDEIEVLKEIVSPVAVSVLAVQLREARERRDEARFDELELIMAKSLAAKAAGFP